MKPKSTLKRVAQRGALRDFNLTYIAINWQHELGYGHFV